MKNRDLAQELGYHGMWNLLRVAYGIRPPRNVVMRMFGLLLQPIQKKSGKVETIKSSHIKKPSNPSHILIQSLFHNL